MPGQCRFYHNRNSLQTPVDIIVGRRTSHPETHNHIPRARWISHLRVLVYQISTGSVKVGSMIFGALGWVITSEVECPMLEAVSTSTVMDLE